jgi:hypothetical protein
MVALVVSLIILGCSRRQVLPPGVVLPLDSAGAVAIAVAAVVAVDSAGMFPTPVPEAQKLYRVDGFTRTNGEYVVTLNPTWVGLGGGGRVFIRRRDGRVIRVESFV